MIDMLLLKKIQVMCFRMGKDNMTFAIANYKMYLKCLNRAIVETSTCDMLPPLFKARENAKEQLKLIEKHKENLQAELAALGIVDDE